MGSCPTVLVVDDDRSLRLLCRVNLELEGFRVLEAENLREARLHLASDSIDAILLDVHVGGDNGLDLLDELPHGDARPGVALFTGTARLDEATRARADGVIPKPFSLEELSGTVRRVAAPRA